MTALVVAVTVAIVAGLLALPPLLRRGAERKLLQIRDSLCEHCGEPIDPGARYVVEGKMVCDACARRTFHRVRAALWGLVAIGVLGAVAGGVAVWARWRRGEAPSRCVRRAHTASASAIHSADDRCELSANHGAGGIPGSLRSAR